MSGPASVNWLDAIFTTDTASLVTRVVEADLAAAFADLRDNREFVAQLTASVKENIEALREVACGRLALDSVDLAEPRRLASLQAHLGVAQVSLQLSYRVGFFEMWRDWSTRIEASDQPIEARSRALRELTELVFAYQNAALAQVVTQHVQVEASLRRSRDHVRHLLVRDLLSRAVELEPADQVILGYDLTCAHVAVAVEAGAGADEPEWTRQIRARCHVHDVLRYWPGDGSCVWWFGQHAWTPVARERLIEVLRDAGLRAEVSDVRIGVVGFREAYEQLVQVRAIRARWARTADVDIVDGADAVTGTTAGGGSDVLHHSDVTIEALLLTNVDAVRTFVVAELGPLAGNDRPAAMLRETLQFWLEARSHVAAATALGLHEHTVRNRIRRIEELLGRAINGRHAELALALRLRRMIGADLHSFDGVALGEFGVTR